MNFKKFLSLMLIICLAFSFVACGTRRADDDDDDSSVSSSRRNRDDDDDDDKTADDDDNGKKSDDKGSRDDTGVGGLFGGSPDVRDDREDDEDWDDDSWFGGGSYTQGSVPRGYPADKYPIYEDGKILFGYEDKNEFGASVYSIGILYENGDIDTINANYRDYLKHADYYTEDKQDYNGLMYYHTGRLKGYNFFFTVAEDPANDGIAVFIDLEEIPSASSVLKEYQEYAKELPARYPSAQFPIIDGGIVAGAREGTIEGKYSCLVSVYTDKSLKEILEFYESVIGSIKNKYKYIDEEYFTLSGETDNYLFSIRGYTDILEDAEVVRYDIDVAIK